MPARTMSQSNEIKEIFYQKIREKVQKEKGRIKGRVEEAMRSTPKGAAHLPPRDL